MQFDIFTNIFFIPILAGTIEGPLNEYISSSMHEPLPLPLRLLNNEDAIRIGIKKNLFDDEYVKLHPYFRIGISDLGGHVRTLEYFYEFFSNKFETEYMNLKTKIMTEDAKLKTAVYNVNIKEIMKSVKVMIINKYNLELNSRWLTIPLAKSILGLPVQKKDVITVNKDSITYEELSSMGVVNLVPMERTKYLIRLPYVWVYAIVESSNEPGFIFWKSMFEYDEPIYWQNFEKFSAQFWALRLSLFRILGYDTINLQELLCGAKFSTEFPAGKVILPKNLKIGKLRHRYPGIIIFYGYSCGAIAI